MVMHWRIGREEKGKRGTISYFVVHLQGKCEGPNSMTEGVRRRTSKWDLREDPSSFQNEIKRGDAWPVKADESFHEHRSKWEWTSSKGNDISDPNWPDPRGGSQPGGSSLKSLSGSRAAQKDGNTNKYTHEISETRSTWGSDQSYGVSPRHDGWRRRSRSHSPRNGWNRSCRSRSRSPSRGFRRESEGRNDRIRSGSGVSAPICKEFARGRCSRGNQCKFLHQDSHGYDCGKHSGSGSAENWANRHEKGGSSGYDIERDYSRNKLSHGHGNNYDGNWDKDDSPRDNRSSNLCNNFMKGRCFRGSSCKFTHDNTLADSHGTKEFGYKGRDTNVSFGADNNREPHRSCDTPCRYFAAGNCRNGVSCKFSHEGAVLDRSEEKSCDSRRGYNLDDDSRSLGGSKKSDEAADLTHVSLEGRSQSGQWGQNSVNEDRPMGGSRWGEKSVDSDFSNFLQWKNDNHGGNSGNKAENEQWGGKKWTSTAADPEMLQSSQWSNNDSGIKVGVPVSQPTERWGHSLDNQNRTSRAAWSEKAAGTNVNQSHLWTGDNNSGSIGVQVSRGHGELPHASNIPFAGVKGNEYSRFIPNGEAVPIHQGLQSVHHGESITHDQSISREVSNQQHRAPMLISQPIASETVHIQLDHSLMENASTFPCGKSDSVSNGVKPQNEINVYEAVVPTMVPLNGQNFVHKENRVNQPFPIYNVEGQRQQIIPSPAPTVQSFDLNGPAQEMFSNTSSTLDVQTQSQRGEMTKRSDTVDNQISPVHSGKPIAQNTVTSEQVAQLTNLSASIAQILEKGQQLPELYASFNSSHPGRLLPSHPNSSVPVVPVLVPSQSSQGSWSQTHYNPISKSINSSANSIRPTGHSFRNSLECSNSTEHETQAPVKTTVPSSVIDKPDGGDPSMNGSAEKTVYNQNLQLKQSHLVDDEKSAAHTMKEKETAHSEDMNVDGRVDEDGKKDKDKGNKDAKGMRTFKFALVEFIKEILKPTWKEGQMSKEAHKTIVKKVVDKVTGALPGDNIPQTREKIDQYLSYSKPKLTKLIQAYVEKYLKT